MAAFNKNNLISGVTAASLTSSATSVKVNFNTDTTSGNATASSSSDVLPTTPFYATLSPAGVIPNLLNSEIVQVTAASWDSANSCWDFTITRAQRSTTARVFASGAVFTNAIYTEDIPSISVVQTTGTSQTDVMSQKAITDKLFYNNTLTNVQIGSSTTATGAGSATAVGKNCQASGAQSSAFGEQAKATAQGAGAFHAGEARSQYSLACGWSSIVAVNQQGAVAIGAYAKTSAVGEFNIGSTNTSYGYNSSNYRLLTGVYDPQSAHDAATKGYVDGTTESYTITSSSWSALSSSDPYDYQATVTATATIGANTIAELINDQAVAFGTYGFAIGSIAGQSVTIYSIGAPSASTTLKINYKG